MYVSYSTFVTFLDWVRDMPVTPSQIDRSLWSAKFAGSTGAQLVTGLRWIGLLDGDRPTVRLEKLARSTPEERKKELTELLRQAYGEGFVDHLPRMTPALFDAALRDLGTTEGTHRKAVSFFVNAAKSAGIDMPMSIQKRARIRSAGARRPVAGNGKRTARPAAEPPAPRDVSGTGSGTPAQEVFSFGDAGTVTLSLDINLIKLTDAQTTRLMRLVRTFRELQLEDDVIDREDDEDEV